MLVMADSKKHIRYMSQAFCGSSHDYAILKTVLPPTHDWFAESNVHIDLGFLGFQNDYSVKSVSIPEKKPRGKELSNEKKSENRAKSSFRVKVEHSIGGLKRYRFLSDRLRVRNFALYNMVAEICAGLWNFCISSWFSYRINSNI